MPRLAILACCALASAASAQSSPQYEVTFVDAVSPTLVGGVSSYPLALNIHNRVVGYGYSQTGDMTPLNWKEGVLRPMHGPAFDKTFAASVNDLGRSVGAGYILDSSGAIVESHALKWMVDSAIDLGSLGGHQSVALCINNQNDTIVGYSTTAGETQQKAFRYANGHMTAFDTLPGATESYPYDISDNNIVCGAAVVGGQTLPFRIRSGVVSQLHLPSGVRAGAAYAVSTIGAAVGTYEINQYTGEHAAVRWRVDGTMVDLGNLGGDIAYAVVRDINHPGQIVGQSLSPDGMSGFLWQNGTMYDLNLLVLGGLGSGVHIIAANAINDSGIIAAAAEINGEQTTVLLTPIIPGIPGPATGMLLVVGGGVMARRRLPALSGPGKY